MGLFPPWVMTRLIDGAVFTKAIGYSFIFASPEDANTIDFLRLIVQWFVIIIITLALIFTFKDPTKLKPLPSVDSSDTQDNRDNQDIQDEPVEGTEKTPTAPLDILPDTEATAKDRMELFGGAEPMNTYEQRQTFPTLQELVKREAEKSQAEDKDDTDDIEKEEEEKQKEAAEEDKKEDPRFLKAIHVFMGRRDSKYVPKFIPRKVWIWVTIVGLIVIIAILFSMPRFKQKGISIFMSDRNLIKEMVTEASQTKMVRGHERFIRSIAYSPDSKYLVTGSYDNTIKIWDATGGYELKTLLGHTDRVRSVKFSPDGKWIASGSDDKTVRLWSVESGLEAIVFEGHTDKVRTVAFHPSGEIIASGSSDTNIKLWSTESVSELRTLAGHSAEIWSVDFDTKGRYLASGGDNKLSEGGQIFLWDYKSSKILRTLDIKTGTPIAIEISPDDQALAACIAVREKSKDGWESGKIVIWELFTGKIIDHLKPGRNITCTSLSFHNNGRLLASGDNQKSIRLWDIKRGIEVKEMKGHLNLISSIAFSPDGTQLVSASTDRGNESGEIHMWGPFK